MKYQAKAFLNVRVPLRDGVELSTNIYLPPSDGPFPVMLLRTPYDASNMSSCFEWIGRGYAFVKQDTRGRFLSGGEDVPWFHEKDDGEDVLQWIVEQPWCNGSIAMYGGSYPGMTQLAAALSGNPALKCITPALIGAEIYQTFYSGGAFRLAGLARWALRAAPEVAQSDFENQLPVSDADLFARGKKIPYWNEVLSHTQLDGFWKRTSFSSHASSVKVPAFIRTGWYDLFISDALDLFNQFRHHAGTEEARRFSRILVGPWPHEINTTKVGEVDYGAVGKISDLYEQEIAYTAHFTTGKSGYDADNAPPLRLFIMEANVWRDEQEWPLARTRWTELHLASAGNANTGHGDGRLSDRPSGTPDQFIYDPSNPVPTLGGAWSFSNIGSYDQSAVEARPDVLVYTSDGLPEDTEVTGPVVVKLFVSTSAPDTDFTAKLVDLQADGRAMSVTDGIIRLSHRNPDCPPTNVHPGEVYECTIQCNPTAYLFKKGHRVRIEISSSNFPVFARNLNSGVGNEFHSEMVAARQTVYHSEQYPSRVILPIIKE